jgi:hypothetical protein
MTRAACISAVLLAMSFAAPASAQEASECSNDRPVVSSGLPTACSDTSSSGVKINRGPEVAPTPSEQRPVRSERAPATRVIRTAPARDRWSYYPAVPRYAHPYSRARRGSSFEFVVQKDDFFFRYGRGGHRPVYRYDSHPRQDQTQSVQGIFPPGTPIPGS